MSVAGHLLTVVNPTTATASAHLAPDDQAEVNANDTTWALSTEVLETAMAMIWGRVAAHKTPLSGFPSIRHTCNLFPYQTLDGMSVDSMGDMILIRLTQRSPTTCLQCRDGTSYYLQRKVSPWYVPGLQ